MFSAISNPMDYRVGLYIRLSKEDESEGPSQSVTNQRSLLTEFARQHRLDVVDTYIDDGFSGTTFDRPAFRRMIQDVERKKINMIVTKDLSRLGRDYITTGHYMERYFPEKRVRYISLLDGIDTGVESTANDITPFRAIMNDMYAKDISKKIKSVKRDKQRKGQFIGGKAAYGYKLHPTEKNKIVIDEVAAAVVRRMFQMALQGTSCRQIAVRLNEEKVPTPATYAGLTQVKRGAYSGLWASERISAMLQNRIYVGDMVQGRSVRISYKSEKCLRQPRDSWVVVEGTHEPMVDRATFDKVQRLLDSRKHTRSRTHDFLLKGLIVCHECGYPLAVLNRKNAKGEEQLYFVCRTYQRFTKAGKCTCHAIQERTVTEAVLARIRADCEGYLQAEQLLLLAQQAVARARQASRCPQEAVSLQTKIDELTSHLDSMYMDKLNGLLADGDFLRIYQRIEAERADITKQLAHSSRPQRSPQEHARLAETLVARFVAGAFANRELLCSLVERIELTEQKQVIIRYRFGAQCFQ